MYRSLRRGLAAASLVLTLAAMTATTQAADKITISALTFVSSSPLFIAQEKGYYADEGLEVEFKFFRAAQPVAVSIASGDADFGVTAFTGGFYNLAGKGALKVIGAQSREEPGYDFSAYIASNKAFEAGFDNPEKFAGKSLGMTQKGSSFHLMAGMLADKLGIDLDEIQLKPLEKVPNMIGALKSGQVDSVILPAHIATKLEGDGAAKIIGWVHQYTPYQLGGLFTSARNVEERRDVVERFVRAYQRAAADYAEAFMQTDAAGRRVFGDKAEALIPVIEKYTKAKPASIKAGAPFIDPQGRLKVQSIYDQVAWMQAQGLVGKDVDPADFVDLSFIEGHLDVPTN
ncbi:ABC transporter substrate-binding protein [Pelagibius litoralis]|uniref:ABC transporter substrate-binding protein n=1 Tax=Pelagibius litoralis TaxID=374515 RepID=A0A967KH47_9PROT|nr:ABC transporter substrate-binding protein [Pelagibius litoralis]NIA70906.1 ABC transporter substrate-binding protein [Pelagibius litoralis]